MKILLTGSHGFIGTHFRKKSGYKNIICWDRKIGKDIKNIRIKDLRGIDVIIHLAADISGNESWRRPVQYLSNNTVNTLKLAEKAVKAGVKKFIFASSAAVYGSPITPYGLSKHAAEDALANYSDKIDIIILRFFNIYGKGQNKEYAGVITKFFECLKKGKTLQVFNNGISIRDFIYIDDVVKSIKRAIYIKGYNVFNIGTGKGIKIRDLAFLFRDLFDGGISVEIQSKFKNEILISIAWRDSQNRRLFNWKFTDLKSGLKKLYKQL